MQANFIETYNTVIQFSLIKPSGKILNCCAFGGDKKGPTEIRDLENNKTSIRRSLVLPNLEWIVCIFLLSPTKKAKKHLGFLHTGKKKSQKSAYAHLRTYMHVYTGSLENASKIQHININTIIMSMCKRLKSDEAEEGHLNLCFIKRLLTHMVCFCISSITWSFFLEQFPQTSQSTANNRQKEI